MGGPRGEGDEKGVGESTGALSVHHAPVGPRVLSVPRPARPVPDGTARAQRVLVAMAATVFVVTLADVVALLVLRSSGLTANDFGSGFLQVLAVLPTPGIALTLLLIIAVVVVTAVRRARSQRG